MIYEWCYIILLCLRRTIVFLGLFVIILLLDLFVIIVVLSLFVDWLIYTIVLFFDLLVFIGIRIWRIRDWQGTSDIYFTEK